MNNRIGDEPPALRDTQEKDTTVRLSFVYSKLLQSWMANVCRVDRESRINKMSQHEGSKFRNRIFNREPLNTWEGFFFFSSHFLRTVPMNV